METRCLCLLVHLGSMCGPEPKLQARATMAGIGPILAHRARGLHGPHGLDGLHGPHTDSARTPPWTPRTHGLLYGLGAILFLTCR